MQTDRTSLDQRGQLFRRAGLIALFLGLLVFAAGTGPQHWSLAKNVNLTRVLDHASDLDGLLAAHGVVNAPDLTPHGYPTRDQAIGLAFLFSRIVAGGGLIVGLLMRRWLLVGLAVAVLVAPEAPLHRYSGLRPMMTVVEGRPISEPGPAVLDPAEAPPPLRGEIEYILAQQAYFQNDPAATATHLGRMGSGFAGDGTLETRVRVKFMAEFAARNGAPPLSLAVAEPPPLAMGWTIGSPAGVGVRVLSLLLVVGGIAAGVLGRLMQRRSRRLAESAVAPAGPAARPSPVPKGASRFGQASGAAPRPERASPPPRQVRGVREDAIDALASRARWVDRLAKTVAVVGVCLLALALAQVEPGPGSNDAFRDVAAPPSLVADLQRDGVVIRHSSQVWLGPAPMFLEFSVLELAALALVAFTLWKRRWFAAAVSVVALVTVFSLYVKADLHLFAPSLARAEQAQPWAERRLATAPTAAADATTAMNLHYVAAQAAYLRGDAAQTARELDAVGGSGVAWADETCRWRVAVMREWAAAHAVGAGPSVVSRFEDNPGSLEARRTAAIGLAGLGLMAAALAALIWQGGRALGRRLGRIDTLRAALA